MAWIRSFRVEGLAGRKDVCELELNEYVNVFFGPNGCGKTSLLRILHSALTNDADIIKDVPFAKAEIRVHSYAMKTDFLYFLDKTEKPQEVRESAFGAARRLRRKRSWKIEPESRSWFHKYLPISRLYASAAPAQVPSYSMFERPGLSEDALEAQFAQNLAEVWKDYSTDVTREVNKAQEAGLARILQAVISRSESSPDEGSGDPTQAYRSVSNFLARRRMDFSLSEQEFLRRYKFEPQLRSVAKDIEAVERKIAEVTQPREDFKKLANEMFFGGKLLGFGDKGEIEVSADGDKIGLATLSSGEKHLLRILVDTLAAGGSMVLIDEPELSMHIEWQQRLIASLRIVNPTAQMIFATHSPEIMANLPDDHIFRLWHA